MHTNTMGNEFNFYMSQLLLLLFLLLAIPLIGVAMTEGFEHAHWPTTFILFGLLIGILIVISIMCIVYGRRK